MRSIHEYKVFIASPGDVPEEREIVRDVCRQLNDDRLVRNFNTAFRPVGWEEAFPAAGRPQKIINRLVAECDIFVCLFHKRFGTPSGEEESGTLEEFLLAYDLWQNLTKPHIMVYFKDVSIRSTSDFKDPQLQKVFELKDKIEKNRLLLFGTFATPDAFRNKITDDLKAWMAEKAKPPKAGGERPELVARDIPAAYRRWIQDRCQYMDIDKLREKSDVIQVNLPEIFIPLYTNDPKKDIDEQPDLFERPSAERSAAVDIEDLVTDGDDLVVEGLPGCGKTTLIKHIAYQMIQPNGFKGLEGCLPVLLFLKDLKGFDPDRDGGHARAESTAEKLLTHYARKTDNGLSLDVIKAFCDAGKAIFMLDGLDEIDSGLREVAVNAFADFRNRFDNVRTLLTGRPHGIDETVIRRFGDRHVNILPFNMTQVEDFIGKWFRFVFDAKSTTGETTARSMISDIKAHPGIEKLIDNPLMLAAICILYHDGRELPGQRAELYKKFITNLLFRRFKNDHERVNGFLKKLSFEMFTAGDQGIDRNPALAILKTEFTQREDEAAVDYQRRLAAKFEEIEPNCGLLTFQEGQYNFRHLTLQEFLTATAIVDRETDYARAIDNYWDDERYQEVIELYVGYLSIDNKRWANKIVEGILKEEDRAPYYRWRLAARALLDMHQDRREIEVIDLATERLRFIIDGDTSARDRADAGELLGWLGDRRDLEKFIAFKNGVYQTPQGKAKIDALEIGAFPVTNQVFDKFVNADSYTNEDFWTAEGWKWRKYTDAKHPLFWQERRWNCPNAPVVGVSWYEADAFARWLTLTGTDGWTYRLPDEKEWEAAAAGRVGREYPWGNEWLEDRCNTKESGIGKTSPVGIFSKGASPEGIFDLGGNVWEWTCSEYHAGKVRGDIDFDAELQKLWDEENMDEYNDKLEEKNRQLPVLRGGYWGDARNYARCADRFWSHPDRRLPGIGFRCARTKK